VSRNANVRRNHAQALSLGSTCVKKNSAEKTFHPVTARHSQRKSHTPPSDE
jgi:hypothetical protein